MIKYLAIKYSMIAFTVVSLSACQLTEPFRSFEKKQVITSISSFDFGQYYLKLKTLNVDELLAEIQLQKQRQVKGYNEAKIKLILLSSLPNSPIVNSYNAKSALNVLNENHSSNAPSTPLANTAFMALLKDQLYEQRLIDQKVLKQEREGETAQLDYQQKMQALKQQVIQLNQQITQLKKIEKSIH